MTDYKFARAVTTSDLHNIFSKCQVNEVGKVSHVHTQFQVTLPYKDTAAVSDSPNTSISYD